MYSPQQADTENTTPGWWRDSLQLLIAAYFAFIFLEGVLRKWYLPSLSDLLFVIRDPIVVMIYLIALGRGLFPLRPAVVALAIMAVLGTLFSVTTDTPMVVVLFGLRTNFLHPPLIFVLGLALNREDATRYARWTLWLAVPILLLMVAQFRAGPGTWVNAGVGGALEGQLMGAMGRVRPSGPFSFTTGIVYFWGLVTAIVIHGWVKPGTYPRLLVLAATVAVVASVPVSISRANLMWILVAAGFAGLALLNPQNWGRMIAAGIPLAIVGGLSLYFLRDSDYLMVFNARWDEAATFGGGDFQSNVVNRLVTEYLAPFQHAANAPIFGHGLGMGTIAGSRLASGEFGFALAEGELGRIVLELGPILGLAFVFWRLWLALALLRHGWIVSRMQREHLSWLLAGATFLGLVSAQWGQATMLGFTVFSAGLALAAMNSPDDGEGEAEELDDKPTAEEIPSPKNISRELGSDEDRSAAQS